MTLRIINANQIRKNCFSLTFTLLLVFIVILTLYTWIFQQRYYNFEAKALVGLRIIEIENTFQFDHISIDGSGRYFVYQNINRNILWGKTEQVFAAIYGSIDQLFNLSCLISNYDGPVFVAVFVDFDCDFETYLKAFAFCNFRKMNQIVFNVVRPVKNNFTRFRSSDIDLNASLNDPVQFCLDFDKCVKLQQKSDDFHADCPIDLLRSVANFGIKSNFRYAS